MSARLVLLFLLFLAPLARAQALDVRAAFQEIAQVHGAQPTHARLLTDNQESWYARWHMVEHARRSIDATYFMLYNEIWGRAFLGLLLKKAKEGVKVRLMLDSKGALRITRSFMGKDFLQELAEYPNVEIRVFNPFIQTILALGKLDLREALASTHDKLLIVDEEWLITGGRNIGQIYCAHPDDNPATFRDTDVLLRGAHICAQAKRAFDEEFVRHRTHRIGPDLLGNWKSRNLELELARRVMQAQMSGMPIEAGAGAVAKALPALLEEIAQYPHLTGYATYEPLRGERPYPALLLDSHARGGTRNDITPNLAKLMDAAREEIIIQNPYVVLTQGGRDAIVRASKRGVKILLNTNSPETSDSLIPQAMFCREWKQLMADAPTLRIQAFRGRNKLHAKVFVLDRKVTIIGSYNLDPLSDEVNSEEVVVIDSPEFAQQNARRIERDLTESVEYRIRVESNGSITQLYGPSDHVPAETITRLQRMEMLTVIRPMI